MRMAKNGTLIGNLACFSAYAIFGFNIISCKHIAIDGNITPMALFCLRSFSAAVLFWLVAAWAAPRVRVEKRDLWKVALASFLGLFATQMTFLYGIAQTTAIDASIINTITPIMALVISAVFLKERIT
ncbi:MAG: DMT family transporter, partial [Bacteroidales bacterium]|nr:DMT family transporter [Bacteroidales bacterium]